MTVINAETAERVLPMNLDKTHTPVFFRAASTRACEVSWFAPICNDDYEFLGVSSPELKSSFENVSRIVQAADRLGFNNMLFPSSFQVGQDTLCFAAAMSQLTKGMSFLVASKSIFQIRPG